MLILVVRSHEMQLRSSPQHDLRDQELSQPNSRWHVGEQVATRPDPGEHADAFMFCEQRVYLIFMLATASFPRHLN